MIQVLKTLKHFEAEISNNHSTQLPFFSIDRKIFQNIYFYNLDLPANYNFLRILSESTF